ncbi:MAG: carboxypeptidase regulatory-like domain-containing protein [Bacteroidota bacterium]|nr:carboxypeptidase regulatory-like domain-containing protein [Bacteroidota bacterium]
MKKISMCLVLALIISGSLYAGNIVGKVKAIGVRNSADAVVYIDKIPSKQFAPPKKHAEFNQQNLMFHPHILPILVGTTVDFLNSDDVLHNVFSPDPCADKFNLGTWPKGQIRTYTFKQPDCRAVILCNVHPEMEAYVVVVETPYFAVTDKGGNYEIKDVPPGKYTLKIWHEKLKGEAVSVEVPAKGNATVNFEIKR